MEKITADNPDAQSADIVGNNLEALRALFPEAFGDRGLDFETLKDLLGGSIEGGDEKYGLSWHGKRSSRRIALAPSAGTLLPCPNLSVDWEATQNILVEGDNLEVLKLFQKSYSGRIKMIYIDPPYNTGKDFIYRDSFSDGIQNYLEKTGQVEGGVKTSSNAEASGRFHTDWLNMMYPRLKLARNLMTDDGVIFISIDDNEVDKLRMICDEIFGEENFISQFVWNTEGHTDNQFHVKSVHEYILLYAKSSDEVLLGRVVDPNTRAESNLWKGFAENSITKNGPANPPSQVTLPVGFPCACDTIAFPSSNLGDDYFEAIKRQGFISRDITDRFSATYPVRLDAMKAEGGVLVAPCRVYSGWANANKLRAFIAGGCKPISEGGDSLTFYLSANGVIYYRRERSQASNIVSVLRGQGTTEKMRSDLEAQGIVFQYPKPRELIQYLIKIGCPSNGIVLDFFAGSGTVAQSCLEQNVEDSNNRRVVLIQLPESTSEHGMAEASLAAKAGFATLADITRKRFLKAGEAIRKANPDYTGDVGFRSFRLATSNIRPWLPEVDNIEENLLENAEHLVQGRNEQDVLYELLLKLGLDLCVPIEPKMIAGKIVHFIGGGALIVCLSDGLTKEVIEPLALGIIASQAELAPAVETRVVFKDSGFADDVAKANMAAILSQNDISDVRSI